MMYSVRQSKLLLLLFTTYYLLPTTYSFADEPSVSYVFPAGGQRGTTVRFNVGGHYLHESCPFEMIGPGVEAAAEIVRAEKTVWFEGPVIPQPESQAKEDYPKDQTGEVKIAADAPLGFRHWRVWTSQGVTPLMKFVVGDLPEVVEQEVEGEPIPTSVSVPVTINGRIFPREDVDIWTIDARAGTSYTCEVVAARIGSPLDARLEVVGPGGQRVAENTDGRGADSFLRFTADVDGVYQVRIHDIKFDGLQHFVYRLTITDQPHVDRVYPLGGQRGTTLSFRLFGQGTPAQPVAIQLPAEGATYEHRVTQADRPSNPFTIELSDLPEQLESESTRQSPMTVPVVLNGQIGAPGETDTWTVRASKDDELLFDLRAARLGSHLDGVLTIFGADGQQLAQNDDLAGGETDSRLSLKTPADGDYTARIEDRFGRGAGAEYAYRLSVTRQTAASPDFQLELSAASLTVVPASEAKLKVVVKREAFPGDIELRIENLPAGVTLKGDKVTIKAGQNDVQLVFAVAADARHSLARVKIIGAATVGETAVTRTARTAKSSPDDIELNELLMAVAVPTPFKVAGVFDTKFAPRGSTFTRCFRIERSGFEGPITISMAERQARHLQGVTGPTLVLPPGQSEFEYPIKLPPWMDIGRTSRTCVMAVGVVEQDGKPHKVSYTSQEQADQIILLVDPGQLDLRLGQKSLVARPGQSIDVPVRVGRGREINGPIVIDLVVPRHIGGVLCEPVTLAADQREATLKLSFAEGLPKQFNMPLTIRATAIVGQRPYTAEAAIEILNAEN